MSELNELSEVRKTEVSIERASPEDAADLYDVRVQTWLATYPNEEYGITVEDIQNQVVGRKGEIRESGIKRWRQRLESNVNDSAMFVARVDNKIIGFTAPRIQDGQRRLGALYVLPEAQGLGAGAKLMEQAINWHGRDNDIYLHVAIYNHNAIGFYEHMGFEKTDNHVFSNAAQLDNGKTIPEIEMVLKSN